MADPFSRRRFIVGLGRWAVWGAALAGWLWRPWGRAWAAAKRKLLPADTPRQALAGMAPSLIDARDIPLTPLDQFDVMGTDDYQVDLDRWRLHIVGAVARPRQFTYDELLRQPVVERKVLLICPMVFANQGRWKGVAIWPLLEAAGVSGEATHLRVVGAAGEAIFRRVFSMADVRRGKLFLCHAVNGRPLPIRHGYPLRIVADDEYGDRWVKYVEKLEVLTDGEEMIQEGFAPGL